jgi:hypothetical protein
MDAESENNKRDGDNPLYGLLTSTGRDDASSSMVKRSLQAIRVHLDMEVAYVSQFVGDRTVFREVDAPGLEHIIKVGDSMSLDDVYFAGIFSKAGCRNSSPTRQQSRWRQACRSRERCPSVSI